MKFFSPFAIDYERYKDFRFGKFPKLIPYKCVLSDFGLKLTTTFEHVEISKECHVSLTFCFNELELVENLVIKDPISTGTRTNTVRFHSMFQDENEKIFFLNEINPYFGFLGYGKIHTNLSEDEIAKKLCEIINEKTEYEAIPGYHSLNIRKNKDERAIIEAWITEGNNFSFIIRPDLNRYENFVTEEKRISVLNHFFTTENLELVEELIELFEKERLIFLFQ
jgi:hypothetical protein